METLKKFAERLTKKITKGKTEKAKQKIERSVFSALCYSNTDNQTIKSFVEDVENGNVWSSDEFLDSSKSNKFNIFDYLIKIEYKPIVDALMWENPTLGSPNAATGDYELMLLITIPNTKKPKKGDIYHDVYGLKNLKGGSPRIFSEAIGKKLNQIMMSLIHQYGIIPWKSKNIHYVQLLNEKSIIHYNKQFETKSSDIVSDILKTWLINLFPSKGFTKNCENIENLVKTSMVGNQIKWDMWVKVNMSFIFEHTKDKNESFVIMYDNGSIYHLTQDVQMFNKLIDSGEIIFKDDYFRLNQDGKCGVYLEVMLDNVC
jgi:hypothetical protein